MSKRPGVLALAATAALIAAAAPAYAQSTERRIGLTVGYPGTIGVLFDVNERIAIRPEFDLSGGSADDTSSTSVGVGASVLFYWPPVDDVRIYFSPRVSYGRSSTEADDFDVDISRSTTSVSGSIGAEFNPRPRFGVFGEAGFQYARSSTDREFLGLDSSVHTWGLRSGVGVIIRF